jgi:hypothetical protein
LFSGEVTELISLRLLDDIIPCDLWGAVGLCKLLWTGTAVVTWVRIKQRQFLMGLAYCMKIQVREVSKTLGEEDTLGEDTARPGPINARRAVGALPRVAR